MGYGMHCLKHRSMLHFSNVFACLAINQDWPMLTYSDKGFCMLCRMLLGSCNNRTAYNTTLLGNCNNTTPRMLLQCCPRNAVPIANHGTNGNAANHGNCCKWTHEWQCCKPRHEWQLLQVDTAETGTNWDAQADS